MPLVCRCLSATEPFGVFPETCIADLLPRFWFRTSWLEPKNVHFEQVLTWCFCWFRKSAFRITMLCGGASQTQKEKEKAGSLHHYLTGRWLVFKKQSQQSQCLNLGPGSYLQHVCPSFYLNILRCKMEIRTAPIS